MYTENMWQNNYQNKKRGLGVLQTMIGMTLSVGGILEL